MVIPPDINRPETFEQDADDVAALLKYLKIEMPTFLALAMVETQQYKLQSDIPI